MGKFNLMTQTENFKKETLTIDIIKANIYGFAILIPIALAFGLPYYFIWLTDFDLLNFIRQIKPMDVAIATLYFFAAMLIGIVLHELIHGATWAIFAKKGFGSIRFGVIWKLLTPYCHCKEPLKVKHYIAGAISPAILLGVLPAALALIYGSFEWLLFGMFFTVAGCGDFMVIDLLRKEKMNDWVQDHPSEAGCVIFRKVETA
ncbi:DUF3267 domain-containing protein [Carboxylicivirga taeanensis]|uniref:DUF3267 domain-containing protein n=1 Tax=Carboxylicivirga taeanensis TaxID=1416875 RepID=UPI003F6E1AB9